MKKSPDHQLAKLQKMDSASLVWLVVLTGVVLALPLGVMDALTGNAFLLSITLSDTEYADFLANRGDIGSGFYTQSAHYHSIHVWSSALYGFGAWVVFWTTVGEVYLAVKYYQLKKMPNRHTINKF